MGQGMERQWGINRSGIQRISRDSEGMTYVEEVDYWDEGAVENCPDDVEPPSQGLDTGWSDLNH